MLYADGAAVLQLVGPQLEAASSSAARGGRQLVSDWWRAAVPGCDWLRAGPVCHR